MPFLGVLGKTAAKKGMHFGAKVWISMPFWASWKRVQNVHFKAKVISMLFLELLERFAKWKKGMHFGAQVWISIPFLGGVEKGQAVQGFRAEIKKIVA